MTIIPIALAGIWAIPVLAVIWLIINAYLLRTGRPPGGQGGRRTRRDLGAAGMGPARARMTFVEGTRVTAGSEGCAVTGRGPDALPRKLPDLRRPRNPVLRVPVTGSASA
jgi:hypothetical protein